MQLNYSKFFCLKKVSNCKPLFREFLNNLHILELNNMVGYIEGYIKRCYHEGNNIYFCKETFITSVMFWNGTYG